MPLLTVTGSYDDPEIILRTVIFFLQRLAGVCRILHRGLEPEKAELTNGAVCKKRYRGHLPIEN